MYNFFKDLVGYIGVRSLRRTFALYTCYLWGSFCMTVILKSTKNLGEQQEEWKVAFMNYLLFSFFYFFAMSISVNRNTH
jgi:hypothetical protein